MFNLVTKSPEVKNITAKILLPILVIGIIIPLSGCRNHNLSGTYYKKNYDTYVFYDTGTVKYDGKIKPYKYIGEDLYIINPGENEKYAKVSSKKITITDSDGRFTLVNNLPDSLTIEKENKKFEEELRGKYRTKIGEVEKFLEIGDGIASIKTTAAGKETEENYICEVGGGKIKLSDANGTMGEYRVKLKKNKLILKNESEEIIYEREN
ncbi:hypothetical protein [Fusobacterium gastrosuis]|uniref:hypothetical protein n=1 Tax=Fusobacterium gastrosuis TaxID=1755100 RepID=UPI002A8ED9FB|nr:hypothetical protein [Anaerovoracaceae bacterium]MDY5305640.1 hypothetical protein [Fusobacterium gastrosuis]